MLYSPDNLELYRLLLCPVLLYLSSCFCSAVLSRPIIPSSITGNGTSGTYESAHRPAQRYPTKDRLVVEPVSPSYKSSSLPTSGTHSSKAGFTAHRLSLSLFVRSIDPRSPFRSSLYTLLGHKSWLALIVTIFSSIQSPHSSHSSAAIILNKTVTSQLNQHF